MIRSLVARIVRREVRAVPLIALLVCLALAALLLPTASFGGSALISGAPPTSTPTATSTTAPTATPTATATATPVPCPGVFQTSSSMVVGGTATLDGNPVPVGAAADAVFNGAVVGCATVTTAGQYRMVVYGNDGATAGAAGYPTNGQTVTIQVNGRPVVSGTVTRAPAGGTATGTYPNGNLAFVALGSYIDNITAVTATPTPTVTVIPSLTPTATSGGTTAATLTPTATTGGTTAATLTPTATPTATSGGTTAATLTPTATPTATSGGTVTPTATSTASSSSSNSNGSAPGGGTTIPTPNATSTVLASTTSSASPGPTSTSSTASESFVPINIGFGTPVPVPTGTAGTGVIFQVELPPTTAGGATIPAQVSLPNGAPVPANVTVHTPPLGPLLNGVVGGNNVTQGAHAVSITVNDTNGQPLSNVKVWLEVPLPAGVTNVAQLAPIYQIETIQGKRTLVQVPSSQITIVHGQVQITGTTDSTGQLLLVLGATLLAPELSSSGAGPVVLAPGISTPVSGVASAPPVIRAAPLVLAPSTFPRSGGGGQGGWPLGFFLVLVGVATVPLARAYHHRRRAS